MGVAERVLRGDSGRVTVRHPTPWYATHEGPVGMSWSSKTWFPDGRAVSPPARHRSARRRGANDRPFAALPAVFWETGPVRCRRETWRPSQPVAMTIRAATGRVSRSMHSAIRRQARHASWPTCISMSCRTNSGIVYIGRVHAHESAFEINLRRHSVCGPSTPHRYGRPAARSSDFGDAKKSASFATPDHRDVDSTSCSSGSASTTTATAPSARRGHQRPRSSSAI